MADEQQAPPKKKKKLLKKVDTPKETAQAESEEGAAGGSNKKIIIIAAVASILMLGVGVGVGYFVSGAMSGDPAASADSAELAAEANAESGADQSVAEEEEEDDAPVDRGHSIYVSVGKLLATVAFNGSTRYIQAEMDLVGYDKGVMDTAQHDMPALRNRLLLLFAQQDFEQVSTVEGREALRKASLDAVNEVLGFSGKRKKIEDVYFTAFVLQ